MYVSIMLSKVNYEKELAIDLAPNVWLHSSVGRASHRYPGGHGFKTVEALNFFSLLPLISLQFP